jgi:hypothetical protein
MIPFAGCGGGADRGPRPVTSPVERARLVCGDARARISTPRVDASPDGLHLEVTNESGRSIPVSLERDSRGGASVTAPAGTSEHVLALAPGMWSVTCYGAGGGGTARFELVDTGIWVSTELNDCAFPESLHGDPPRILTVGEGGLTEHARQGLEFFTTLEPGDVIEPAGYPEQRDAIFRVRRDGRTIATISFFPAEGGTWTEGEVTSCGG